jgi:hypothetical protein
MEISQTPLSSNKTSKSRTAFPSASSPAARLQEGSKAAKLQEASRISPETAPVELKKGQMLRGKIVDLRYNSVRIRLEPGQQIITAGLEGDFPLAIGETAQFQVLQDSSDRLVLKYIPANMQAATETMIEKALLASKLPLTDSNKALVMTLLDYKMSIDKQTLQTMVKLSHQYHDTSFLTLVLMHKYNLPVTKGNIARFEAYTNGTNQLLTQVNAVTKNIAELLPSIGEANASDALFQVNDTLLSLLEENADTKAFDFPAQTTLGSILPEEDRLLLGEALKQQIEAGSPVSAAISDNIIDKIADGTLPLSDTIALLTDTFMPEQVSLHTLKNEMNGQAGPLHANSLPLPESDPAAAIIASLIEKYPTVTDSPEEIRDLLNVQERENLLTYVRPYPMADDLREQIAAGTARIQDLLQWIKSSLSPTNPHAAKELLQSPEYSKLLAEAFRDKWTLTPEKLRTKDSVLRLYEDLEEDLKKLDHLLETGKEVTETARLQEPVKSMQENLTFLKDLNQIAAYLPLPIQFKNQDAQCDLYVLARKKAAHPLKDGFTLLLHLDMTHLGMLNIHVRLEQKQILAKFYTEKPESRQLLSDHMSALTDALQKKGYRLHAEVTDTYEQPDLVKDLIEPDTEDSDIRRYTFDVRT